MGLCATLHPDGVDHLEGQLARLFLDKLSAERHVCSFFKLFPVGSVSSQVVTSPKRDYRVGKTTADVVTFAEEMTRQFMDDARSEIAGVVTSPAYAQKVAGWPLVEQLSCPASRRDANGNKVPFLPNGPVLVAVEQTGTAGSFRVCLARGWAKLFTLKDEPGTNLVRLYFNYEYAVETVI